jgi:hypothetical protein
VTETDRPNGKDQRLRVAPLRVTKETTNSRVRNLTMAHPIQRIPSGPVNVYRGIS